MSPVLDKSRNMYTHLPTCTSPRRSITVNTKIGQANRTYQFAMASILSEPKKHAFSPSARSINIHGSPKAPKSRTTLSVSVFRRALFSGV